MGAVQLTVARTGGSLGAATVYYSSSDGTAAAGSDFTGVSGTPSFASGQNTMTLRWPVDAAEWTLQTNPTLDPATWSDVPARPLIDGAYRSVTVGAAGPRSFLPAVPALIRRVMRHPPRTIAGLARRGPRDRMGA